MRALAAGLVVGALVAGLVAGALVACDDAAGAPDAASDAAATRPIVVDHIEDIGAFPAPPTVVGRDGTTSASLGGRLVWTFGDAFLNKPTLDDGTSLRSASAGWSSPDAPLALDEAVDDAGIPIQFIPYTPAELAQNQADGGAGVSLWPGAVIPTSAASAVVLFEHVQRATFSADAIGTATLAPSGTQTTRDATFLFQSPEPLFGNGGATVDGGYAYLFDCEINRCKLARAPVASVATRSAFEFWDGTSWVVDIAQAAWFIQNASYALSIEFNPFLNRYLAVYGKPVSDDIGLRAADHIEGPWSDPEVLVPGGTSGLVTGDAGVNYLAKEHGELRSADGRTLVIGYAHPLPGFGAGAPRLARLVLR